MNNKETHNSKKFSLSPTYVTASPKISADNFPRDIEKQVTVIEIGCENDEVQIKKCKRKTVSKTALPALILTLICLFTFIPLALFPLPKPVNRILIPLAEYVLAAKKAPELWLESSVPQNSAFYKSDEKNRTYTEEQTNTESFSNNEKTLTQETPDSYEAVVTAPAGKWGISNETSYVVSAESIMNKAYPIGSLTRTDAAHSDSVTVFAQSLPEILIIHTHGTEGYADCRNSEYRTEDTSRNVVRVGRELYEVLTSSGLSVIHCEEMFDKDSYIHAYSNSRQAVNEYLSKYPSIKYVIDLHRDAATDEEGNFLRPVTNVHSSPSALLMLVIGTDEAGAQHPRWQNNLRTAAGIQQALCTRFPGLMRGINLRRASFNQQLCDGYFILEAGNCANTLDEALCAVKAFGEVFADTASPPKAET